MAEATESEQVYLRWLGDGGWKDDVADAPALEQLDKLAHQTVLAWASTGARTVLMRDGRGVTKAHPLIPHPGCPVCAAAVVEPDPMAWDGWRDAQPGPPLESLAQRLEAVTGDLLGLSGHASAEADDFGNIEVPLHHAAVRFAEPSPARGSSRVCAGTNASGGMAIRIAVAECLERSCGVFPSKGQREASYRELAGERALDPNTMPVYSEAQFASPGFPLMRAPPYGICGVRVGRPSPST